MSPIWQHCMFLTQFLRKKRPNVRNFHKKWVPSGNIACSWHSFYEKNVQICVIFVKTVSRICNVAKWYTVFTKMCEKNVQMCAISIKMSPIWQHCMFLTQFLRKKRPNVRNFRKNCVKNMQCCQMGQSFYKNVWKNVQMCAISIKMSPIWQHCMFLTQFLRKCVKKTSKCAQFP